MNDLDAYLPAYEFSERHRIRIDAPPERIDGAFREVTLAELPVSRVLFALRGLPRRGRFVERVPGRVLEDAPGEGLVLGLRGQFWRPRGGDDGGPAAEAVADFRLEPGGLATETRIHVEDPAARRRFRRYWRVIRPFSGLIRIEYLRAAKRRAEARG
jgi:hypothetical protein